MQTLAIIGGSGLYELDGVQLVREHGVDDVQTPYGAPSDTVIEAVLHDVRLLFLPRHGRGHRIAPHQINARANVAALKTLGAEQVLSISAVGSLEQSMAPGHMVVVSQFIDRTRLRPCTFFEDGIVGHVEFAEPTDAALNQALLQACEQAGGRVHDQGTYVCIEGPQFSTLAESKLYRTWGAHVVGMTNLPEARLCREAQMPYASLAMVTDYDCWNQQAGTVQVTDILKVLSENVVVAKSTIANLVQRLPDPKRSPATGALKHAIITEPDSIPEPVRQRLAWLLKV